MSDVTKILTAIEDGSTTADELLPLVYEELRKLATAKLSREKPGQTIQATVLVHEAWMRLVGSDAEIQWKGRGHFFGAAARAMQRILVENARRTKSLKAGGEFGRVELSQVAAQVRGRWADVLEVNEALEVGNCRVQFTYVTLSGRQHAKSGKVQARRRALDHVQPNRMFPLTPDRRPDIVERAPSGLLVLGFDDSIGQTSFCISFCSQALANTQ